MRILVVCQHYKPEPFNVHEVCEELSRMGHSVTVLTALPNYPSGVIDDAYRFGRKRDESINGVRVMRVPVAARGRDLKGINKIRRVLNYISFPLSSALMQPCRDLQFDCVLAFQYSPILMTIPALKIAKKQGIPILIWAFDLWPEDLITGGFSKESFAYRIMKLVSRELYGRADRVAITSKGFVDYFKVNLGLLDIKTIWLPQFAEAIFENLPFSDVSDHSPLIFTFAGNIGGNQSVETIVRAVALLPDELNVEVHVVGSGSRLDYCRNLAKELGASKVQFDGRKSLEEMPSIYQRSSAMLLTLAKPSSESLVPIYTVPRKVQSYLAAKKPILCSVDGAAAQIVQESRCGITCAAEDPAALARAMTQFSQLSIEQRRQMSMNAWKAYREHYSRTQFFRKLDETLTEMVERGV